VCVGVRGGSAFCACDCGGVESREEAGAATARTFHPVGTSKYGIFSFSATRSSAHEVGIERAQPFKPPL